jgi:hypothetical protein
VKPKDGVGETLELTIAVAVGVSVSVDMMMGPGSVGENMGPQAEVKNINPIITKSFLGIIRLPPIK